MAKWHHHVVEKVIAASVPKWYLIIPFIYQCQVAHSGVCACECVCVYTTVYDSLLPSLTAAN